MSSETTAQDKLHKIVEDGMCLGCGLCAALSGESISMGRGTDGDLRPFASDGFTQDHMTMIEATCPSLRIEGLPDSIGKAAPHQDVIWGPYHEMSLAYANDEACRHQASTAGLLTMMALYLLDKGLVDGILHVKAAALADGAPSHHLPANFGIATISQTRDEVIAASGSRYGPTAALATLEEVLSSSKHYAVIAKPCDLNALRNLAHHDARVTDRLGYFLTMLCGGFQPDDAFQSFLKDHDLTSEGLRDVRYRGYGCPGPTSLTYEDGTRHDFHYLDFWGEDESQWSMPLRCKICPDGIGEAADFIAGDAWDGASPVREDSKTDKGFNSVITRSAKGDALYQAAIADGYIIKSEIVDCDYMSSVQPHQVTKKLAAQARLDGLKEAGSVAPELVNLRAEALTKKLGTQAYDTQKTGGYERALKAKHKQ